MKPTDNPCAEMDLGGRDPLSPDAARAPGTMGGPILDALDDLDGLSLRHVSFQHDDLGRMHGTVSFTGWSPSLHAVPVERMIMADSGGQDEAIFRLTHLFAEQRRRAADARAVGIVSPLRDFQGAGLHHLWTDMTLVLMRMKDPTLKPVVAHLEHAIERIHRSGQMHDGGPFLAHPDGVVGEVPWGSGRAMVRMAGATVEIHPGGAIADTRQPGGKLPSFDGVTVSIPSQPLPETALAGLSGRPLADLARLHPLLDGRIINNVRNSTGATRVIALLEPDLVRVRDI